MDGPNPSEKEIKVLITALTFIYKQNIVHSVIGKSKYLPNRKEIEKFIILSTSMEKAKNW